MSTDFNRSFKIFRFLWCIFLFIYFYHFPKNFFAGALPEKPFFPTIFFQLFCFWLIIEYYFSSPFFQSGLFPFSVPLKYLFSFYFYPFLIFLVFDYGWWGRGQVRFLYPSINIFGLLIFLFGMFLRLFTLFLFLNNPLSKLVRGGIFRISRHPRYLATLIQLVSLPFIFSSLFGFFLLIPGILIIKKEAEFEDRELKEYLKRDYDRYLKNVPLLFPVKKI